MRDSVYLSNIEFYCAYVGYCKDREMEKGIKSCMLDEMGLESSAIMSNAYSVSKKPPCSMEDPLSFHVEALQTLDRKNALLGSSSGPNMKGLRKKPEKLGKKVISLESHADSCEEGGEILSAESYKGLKVHQDMCSPSETVTKPCLKVSSSTKLSRSVTWADQNDGRGDHCEVRSKDIESGLNLSSTDTEDVNCVSRFALAEACATALSQAD